MSDISRRDALRRVGLVLMTTGLLDRIAGAEVHEMASQARAAAGGAYTPKALSAQEYATLEALTDLIIPVENGKPGAVAAGAAAWIDMMASENDRLKGIFAKGLAWLDTTMAARARRTSSARRRPPGPGSSTSSPIDGTRPRSSRPASSSSAGRGG